MMDDDSQDDAVRRSYRRTFPRQFSLRTCLKVVTGCSTLFSAMHWLPGLGGLVLLMLGWFFSAAAVLGVLILLQWPLMVAAIRLSESARAHQREERRALRYLRPSVRRI